MDKYCVAISADANKGQMIAPEDRPKRVFKEIDVEYPDLDKKPYFEFPLRDRFIQENDTFKLTCTIEGFPHPEVRLESFYQAIVVTTILFVPTNPLLICCFFSQYN